MLKGKTALVTGSTSGIGLGIAKALARQGANIVLNGFGEVEAPRAEVLTAGEAAGATAGDTSAAADGLDDPAAAGECEPGQHEHGGFSGGV